MKVLVFGNSHVASLMLAYKKRSRCMESPSLFYKAKFIGISGPNYNFVEVSESKSIIKIPKEEFSYTKGVPKGEPYRVHDDTDIFYDEYDVTIFVKGPNIIDFYHNYFDVPASYPPLMTSSLAEQLIRDFIDSSEELKRLVSNAHRSKIFYIGKPTRFAEINSYSELSHLFSLHKRNIGYLRKICETLDIGCQIIFPPSACTHSSGLFSFDEYANNFPKDKGHAGASYGSHLWDEIHALCSSHA
jgi:hypothetical protein